MSDCDCCDCSYEANYRNQRIKPDGVTFAAWCNGNRDFFAADGSVSESGDAGAPTHIVTGGGWVPVNAFTSDFEAQDGFVELRGIYGNSHEIVAGEPRNGWGYLWWNTFARGVIVSAFGEDVSTESFTIDDDLILREIDGFSTWTMTFDGESIIYPPYAGAAQRIGIEVSSSTKMSDESGVEGLITARGPGASRDDISVPLPRVEQAFSVASSLTPMAFPYASYSKGPFKLQGAACKLYRDGELVWQATRPNQNDSLAHTTDDGVYLWVSEVGEASDPPWTGQGADTRGRVPAPFKQMASFVVDNHRPVIGATAPCDYFADRPEDVMGNRGVWEQDHRKYLVATKPLPHGMEKLVSDFGNEFVRPLRVHIYGAYPQINWVRVANLGAGRFLVEPSVTGISPLIEQKDAAGNTPARVPQFPLKVHAVPANNRRGARPLFEDVGLQTREHGRARSQDEKIKSVRLSFDRKVRASDVNADQITLNKDGEVVPGCTIAQLNDLEWLVTLPESATQPPESFWFLEYDPGGSVMTDDVDEQEFGSLSDFPPVAQAKYRRVYVARDTSKRYSKGPSQYVELLAGSPPLDENGVPFEPEPSVLAARVSWLMAMDGGWKEPIDVSSTTVQIGSVMSISKSVGSLPPPDGKLKIESTGAVLRDWGKTRGGIYTDRFTPQVPTQSGSQDDCSYWGLSTTIDPCPPKRLVCPVAKVAQKHSSVIRSNDDKTSFTLSHISADGNVEWSIIVSNEIDGVKTAQNSWIGRLEEDLEPHDPIIIPRGNALGQPEQALWGYLYRLNNGDTYSRSAGGWQLVTDGKAVAPDGGSFPPVGRVKGIVFVNACRNASQHLSLETSILWELELYVNVRTIVRSVDPQTGAVRDDLFGIGTDRLRVTFSRDKEDEFAAGQTVTLPHSSNAWRFEPA